MTKSSVITNRLSSTMAELIIDYLFSPISQPVQSLISERTYDQDTSYFYVFKRTEYDC